MKLKWLPYFAVGTCRQNQACFFDTISFVLKILDILARKVRMFSVKMAFHFVGLHRFG